MSESLCVYLDTRFSVNSNVQSAVKTFYSTSLARLYITLVRTPDSAEAENPIQVVITSLSSHNAPRVLLLFGEISAKKFKNSTVQLKKENMPNSNIFIEGGVY